jgi:molybdopterin converting factor small subunit
LSARGAEPVRVVLAPALRQLFPDLPAQVRLPAGTIAELLQALDGRWPGIADRVRDETPAIRRHMNVFVDGARASLETPVPAGAEVFVLTAISGG